MEIVRSLNRSLAYNTYFRLYRAIHPGGKVRGENVRGEMSGYHIIIILRAPILFCFKAKTSSRAKHQISAQGPPKALLASA